MLIRHAKLSAPGRNRGRQLSAAQKKIIEKWHTKYVNLSCGHVSTWEVDKIYSFGKPNKKMSWCERCSKWSNMIPIRRTINNYPDVPMF